VLVRHLGDLQDHVQAGLESLEGCKNWSSELLHMYRRYGEYRQDKCLQVNVICTSSTCAASSPGVVVNPLKNLISSTGILLYGNVFLTRHFSWRLLRYELGE